MPDDEPWEPPVQDDDAVYMTVCEVCWAATPDIERHAKWHDAEGSD